MKPYYPYELESHELANWERVWARWRNNANVLMKLGWPRDLAEFISATWPESSDDLLGELDDRRPAFYDVHGAVILEHPGCH